MVSELSTLVVEVAILNQRRDTILFYMIGTGIA